MFSRNFKPDHKKECTYHGFVMSPDERAKEVIIEEIMKGGLNTYFAKRSLNVNMANCCSATKNAGYWFFFAIPRARLANVGLDEQDLIRWLNFLNTMKAGFEYYYFGEQQPSVEMLKNLENYEDKSNTYYWVGVPRFGGENWKLPYLHWIALRYLTNTEVGVFNREPNRTETTAPYYLIPRITIMLHEEHKLPKLRAFFYAHATLPFYYYKCMCYAGHVWSIPNLEQAQQHQLDVGVLTTEFRRIWKTGSANMNCMFTPANNTYKGITDIRTLRAPYNIRIASKLFEEGKYNEFIKYLRGSYRPKKEKKVKNVEKEVVA
jgi:hypothetical protein